MSSQASSCPRCRAWVNPGATHCVYCGSALGFNPYARPPTRSSAWIIVVLFLVLGLVVAGAVVGYVLVVRRRPPDIVSQPSHVTPESTYSPPVKAAMPFAPGQTWVGTYTCSQGDTDLTLAITRVDGMHVYGVFKFRHAASGAKGSYDLDGTFDPTTSGLTLLPGEWIEHPKGYTSVGMIGTVSNDVYSGTIDFSGCSAFSVRLRS